jgi:glycerol-3-phosphate dehydrogenase
MMEKQYDVIILGAGINGSGIARQLTMEGKRVLLLDKTGVAAGTSSKSSRLIHGGLRYLETGNLGLVHEALKDRKRLTELYPDLVAYKPFYVPIYNDSPRPPWMIRIGLLMYDLLAGARTPVKSGAVETLDFLSHFPALSPEGIRRVFQYPDAKTQDDKLTQRVVDDFISQGGEILAPIDVKNVEWTETGFKVETEEGYFQSQHLVNATGPWVDEVNTRYSFPARFQIRKVSGIHVFLKGLLVRDLLFLQTASKRIFFVVPEPENNQTMIGTTEREELGLIDDVQVQQEDVDYVINAINAYLGAEDQISRYDVEDVSIGVRALVQKSGNPTDLSREYQLDLHRKGPSRLLHVFGGKLTTFLSLAEKAARKLK